MKQKVNTRKWLTYYLLLLLLVSLYGINIYRLTAADSAPPMWDEAVHLRDSLVFHNVLSNPFQLSLRIVSDIVNQSDQYPLIRPSWYYPPLAPTMTSFLYFIFGTSTKVAVMSNVIFLLILVFSVYGTGALIFNRKVGLLASALILLFPIILKNSVIYMLDLPLTAMVALGVFILLKSDCFKDTKFSTLSGFAFGLGMLTKWTYLFFVIGPLCYLMLKVFYPGSSHGGVLKEPFDLRKSFKNIVLFALVSVVTFGPYYFPILPALIKETLKFSSGTLAHGPDSLLSFASVSFYPVVLWNDMVNTFGFILFIVGIVLLSFSKNSYKNFLLIWILVPYFIFTFVIHNKQPRYMMPWLVPISLVISFFINEIGSIRIFGKPFKLKRYAISLSLILFCILFFRENSQLQNSILDSSKEDWKINEIVTVLEEDINDSKSGNQSNSMPMYVGVIPDHHYINSQTIRYYVTLRRLPLNVIKLQNYEGTAFREFVENFERYDYILTKNSSNIVIASFQESIDKMHEFFYSRIDNFQHLRTFQEPDGSQVSLFKRRQ